MHINYNNYYLKIELHEPQHYYLKLKIDLQQSYTGMKYHTSVALLKLPSSNAWSLFSITSYVFSVAEVVILGSLERFTL